MGEKGKNDKRLKRIQEQLPLPKECLWQTQVADSYMWFQVPGFFLRLFHVQRTLEGFIPPLLLSLADKFI